MTSKLGTISYVLVTMASICFASGLLVLTGGESDDRKIREVRIDDRQHA